MPCSRIGKFSLPATLMIAAIFAFAPTSGAKAHDNTAEAAAVTAGELVSQAEDMSDDSEVKLNDLVDDWRTLPSELSGNAANAEKRSAAKSRAEAVAESISETLARARAAKSKGAGAAAGAKKFGPAKPKILAAEASFKAARIILRKYHLTKTAALSPAAVKALNDLLRDAHAKIKADIEHVKEILLAIE